MGDITRDERQFMARLASAFEHMADALMRIAKALERNGTSVKPPAPHDKSNAQQKGRTHHERRS